ncbi:RND multidrug efflux transporter [Vibrio ishigakensis]|uniref:RND multidrug efflux transporter n=1 Tax=Vibrio ishigakensis TaxID=1481914 RepID=A0A0B8PFB0_9VIBR|nr:RND multidrug efflux transporter [Vibrio ishigakensis]
MYALIDVALSRSRTILTLLVMLIIAGVGTYLTIPKESSPDITILSSTSR